MSNTNEIGDSECLENMVTPLTELADAVAAATEALTYLGGTMHANRLTIAMLQFIRNQSKNRTK